MMGKYNLKQMGVNAFRAVQSFSIENIAKNIADMVSDSANVKSRKEL
jgi:hypothetical protein